MLFEDIDKSFQGGLHLLPRIRNLDRPRFSYSCLICQQPYCCCKHLNLLPLLPLLPSSLPFSKNKRQNLRPFSGLIPAPLPGHKPHPCCKYLCLCLSVSLSHPHLPNPQCEQILQQIQTQNLQPRILILNAFLDRPITIFFLHSRLKREELGKVKDELGHTISYNKFQRQACSRE